MAAALAIIWFKIDINSLLFMSLISSVGTWQHINNTLDVFYKTNRTVLITKSRITAYRSDLLRISSRIQRVKNYWSSNSCNWSFNERLLSFEFRVFFILVTAAACCISLMLLIISIRQPSRTHNSSVTVSPSQVSFKSQVKSSLTYRQLSF